MKKLWKNLMGWRKPGRHSIRIIKVPELLRPQFYFSIFAYPFSWLYFNWQRQRTRDLILGLPGLLGLIGIPIFLTASANQQQKLGRQYYQEGHKAVDAGQYDRASMLLTRSISMGGTQVGNARFAMAILFEETGQTERAKNLFSLLAPDDEIGNRAAHRRMAILLSDALTEDSQPKELETLFWHLSRADDKVSPQLCMSWGRYFFALGDVPNAKKFFQAAVKEFPELWQVLGAIELDEGNQETARNHYQRSEELLSARLSQDPKDSKSRMDYANVLTKLGKLDHARLILEQGKIVDPEGPWPWLLASLAVNYHDMRARNGESISVLFGFLDRALKYEPNHAPALTRLMKYATAKASSNTELKIVLARVIAEGEQPALAHLAMGNLFWLEKNNERAMVHFEQAIALREDLGPVLNNMAWMVAHNESSPDLARATVLIETALETQPENCSFLDTRGTIYMLKEDWNNALVDLEKSLAGIRNRIPVHRKLAIVYAKLNMPEIAEQHQQLAGGS